MARFTVCLLALVLAVCQISVIQAAPLGNLKCNLARLKTATNLKAATQAVDSMADLAVNTDDAAMADAVTEAQTGLTEAGTAVQGIATALKAKQAPPAALRGQALNGLTGAKAALDKIKAAKGGAAAGALQKAKTKVAAALAAGNQVIENCGGDATADAAAADAAAADATATDAAAAADATATDATATDAAAATDTAVATDAAATPAASAPATKNAKTTAVAAKTEKRQLGALGGIKCNAARLSIVANLAKTNKAVKSLATASAADSIAADAATAATAGLADAKAGIATIAKGLLTGSAPPAEARTQVGDGLTAAKTALTGISSTDPAITAAVADAQGKLDKTIAAGNKVVANC